MFQEIRIKVYWTDFPPTYTYYYIMTWWLVTGDGINNEHQYFYMQSDTNMHI